MDALIQIKQLSKIYGTYFSRARVTSLRNISFDVKEGERVCLFGPNGAGKSTIMKAIMGLIKPTKGKVFVKGYDAQQSKLTIKKLIGYLPSELDFYANVAIKESLYHFGLLRGLKRAKALEETNRLLEMMGLSKWWDLSPQLMSSGMKQRFSLALALIGDPEIILFDEPISFIDVQGKMKIYQLVHDYVVNQNKTIIMCTHNIQDALIMSDRLIVIDRGEILIDGPITEVITERCKSMEIILTEEAPNPEEIKQILGDENYQLSGRKIMVQAEDALQLSISLVNRLQENRIPVFSFRPFVEQRREKKKMNLKQRGKANHDSN
ncbi:MAG: ABC transporter ATP-binding protein [Candidatus Heimdallarchaeota archaeon]|nr:ABC transporter ATP-binding protein [Candidatus Heimdallarchaeota archaeon]